MEQVGRVFLLLLGTLFLLHFARRPIKLAVRSFRHLAEHRRLAILISGLFPVVIRLALLPLLPHPEPTVHDEFSYLVAAQMYERGVVAMPPHPMWQHFETFHVLQQPKYASKYLPGQAALLAAGQLIFRDRWAGILLSVGLFCGAVCWMLQAAVPPAWALFGGLVAGMHLCIFTYWSSSYWGGALSALGGALALGAVLRLRNGTGKWTGWILGIGFAVLFLARPYEGAVFGAACAAIAIRHWSRMLPAAIPLGLAIAAVLVMNHQIMGSALQLPYTRYERDYTMGTQFIFLQPRTELPYRHEVMRAFYAEDLAFCRLALQHPLMAMEARALVLFFFYLADWFVVLPIAMIPWMIRWKRAQPPLAIFAVMLVALSLERALLPHYAAPMAGLVILLYILGLHKLRLWNPGGKPTGSVLARAAIGCLLVTFALKFIFVPQLDLTGEASFRKQRAEVLRRLRNEPPSLVIVKYGKDHDVHTEWVYNDADIDRAQIVWARDMGEEKNRSLIEYFRGRKLFYLYPEEGTKLQAYP